MKPPGALTLPSIQLVTVIDAYGTDRRKIVESYADR